MMGTGWLVRPDLLITAGHVVFDYSYEYRAAVQIKCYIGYDGRNSVGGPTCQPRYGKHVVTTGEWTNEPNRRKDLAFILGYPGDMSVGGETGAQMYELSKKTKYDLDDNDLHMIKYKISTFGGEYIPR
jgi:V8-like Glu-specific endopeptidase